MRSHCLFLLGVVGEVLGVLSLGASGAQTGEMLAQFVCGTTEWVRGVYWVPMPRWRRTWPIAWPRLMMWSGRYGVMPKRPPNPIYRDSHKHNGRLEPRDPASYGCATQLAA